MKISFFKQLFSGLMFGLKSADKTITTSSKEKSDDSHILQGKIVDNVFSDFLAGEETQRVIEYRDAYYRDFIESDHYKLNLEGMGVDGDNGEINDSEEFSATATKKSISDYIIKGKFYNPKKHEIRVVQDNKFVQSHIAMVSLDEDGDEAASWIKKGEDKAVPLIDIIRDDFTPRFKIEEYANKVVVRHTKSKKKWYIDLYTTMYASQFGKVDAILIATLNRMKTDDVKKSDITDIKGIRFVTDKAAGEDDLRLFEFDSMKFLGIDTFDGNFILRYEGKLVHDGFDITAKYRTKELDEKYLTNAPRDGKVIDMFTIERNLKKKEEKDAEYNKTTIKLD